MRILVQVTWHTCQISDCDILKMKFFFADSDEDNKDFKNMLCSDSNNNQKSGYGGKKSRYFWQYNVQAKGPKGQRLVIKTNAEDPHHLNEATDPVFSPNCSIHGIKVSIIFTIHFNNLKFGSSKFN
jgi:hypothetical protein